MHGVIYGINTMYYTIHGVIDGTMNMKPSGRLLIKPDGLPTNILYICICATTPGLKSCSSWNHNMGSDMGGMGFSPKNNNPETHDLIVKPTFH